jgi:hypothetical protein
MGWVLAAARPASEIGVFPLAQSTSPVFVSAHKVPVLPFEEQVPSCFAFFKKSQNPDAGAGANRALAEQEAADVNGDSDS